jgi:hypothetical protein
VSEAAVAGAANVLHARPLRGNVGAMHGRPLAFAFAVRLLRPFVAAAVFVAALAAPRTAGAWYFPEHVVLASDGHAALAPELRAVIAEAVAAARAEGLDVCERTDLTLDEVLVDVPLATRMISTPASVPCVPYAAIAGLAGDHASDVDELRTVLTSSKGVELVSTVAYEWRRFRESVERGRSTVDRMSFVHDLDVALYFLDSEYAERARATRVHFRDLDRSFEGVLRDLAHEGRIDDVVARFVFHHMRSLVLAAKGRRVEALLDHAFAVHFLEDTFAAGHLVMSRASWAEGRDSVRLRHDAFNADGLAVTRAMSREPCSTLATGTLERAGLPPCWNTTGDGHLGLTGDSSDRLHVAAALSRAELAFAFALDPERVLAYARSLGDLQLLALGTKLNPVPWWTLDPQVRRTLPTGAEHAMRLVQSAADAVTKLRKLAVPASASVATKRLPGAVDLAIIDGVLDPRLASGGDQSEDRTPDDGADAGGVYLLRPILAQLPASQRDTATMHPEGRLDHGWAVQLFAATGGMVMIPRDAPVDLVGPGVSASVGFSYRWGTLLPGRRARAIAEVNLGTTTALHVNTRGQAGGNALVTLLDQELRWPILWEALTTYKLPLDLTAIHRAGRVLVFNGIRAHEVVRGSAVAFLGAEIETLAIALGDGRGTHPLYAVSPDLRFYVGLANPRAVQPSYESTLGVTFGITLTGGYATFL